MSNFVEKVKELDTKIQELDNEIQKRASKIEKLYCRWTANDVTTIFIRAEGTTALLQFTIKLIGKVSKKASQSTSTNLKNAAFPRFRGAVERVHEHISETLDQHRVQQFFTEDEIRKQLDELHKKLGESYSALTNDSEDYSKRAKNAEEEDNMLIDEYVKAIDGDVTIIAQTLECGNPPKDAMSMLQRVGGKGVVPASLLRDYIKCIRRDWFWLTFKSETRQRIKAPLTRVVKEIIPSLEALPDDDRIALSSNELTGLQMVDRLFATLDNSSDPALRLVKSLRSALAATDNELRGNVKDEKFLDFAQSLSRPCW